MSSRRDAEETLRALAPLSDAGIDLGEAALALAAFDRPRVPLDRYREHLSRLADETTPGPEDGDGALGLLSALNRTIVGEHGYSGDTRTYDDLQNANLIRVIDRKKGLPVALGVLYLQTAQRLGWGACGLNFPGHFMIRLERGNDRIIADPFSGGAVRDAASLRELLKAAAGDDAELSPRHYEPVGNRDVLLRLQNNIKARHLSAGRFEEAGDVIARMLMFAPSVAALWREAGIVHVRLGSLHAAIESVERYMALAQDDRTRHDAATLLQRIKNRLN